MLPLLLDILAFLIPCLQFIQVNLIGVINCSDVLLLLMFVYLAFRGRLRIASPTGKRFVVLCLLWLASQIVTDIVRHSALVDYALGWSNIGLTLVNFAAVYTLLYGRRRRIVLYGWGMVVGSSLRFVFLRDDIVPSYPRKFG